MPFNGLRKVDVDAGLQTGVEAPPPQHAQEHPVFSGEPYGIVTAENPKFPTAVRGNNRGLEDRLNRSGLKYDKVAGHYDSPEHSFIVYGPTRDQMRQFGKEFGQESVLFGEGGRHELHFVNGANEGKYIKDRGDQPVSYFNMPPPNYYTALPGGGFVRINLDWDNVITDPSVAAKSERVQMKQHTMDDVKAGIAALLKKYEADFIELSKRELGKADPGHMEPGMHEAPQPGVAEHAEPGGHEQFEMDTPDTQPQEPVSSSAGIPSGELMAPTSQQPTSQDPNAGMGEDRCVTCGNPDRPGACTCLGASGMQFGRMGGDRGPTPPYTQPGIVKNDLMGYGMDSGAAGGAMGSAGAAGSGLALSEDEESGEESPAPECPTCGGPSNVLGSLGNRKHFKCRNCGMQHSTVPPKDAKKSDKEPSHQPSNNPDAMAMAEESVSEKLCKPCGKVHKAGEACMAKGADFMDPEGKKKSTGVVGVLPHTDDKLGPGMSGPKCKVIPSPGSGGEKRPVKKADEDLSKPPKSEAQRRAMGAAAGGNSTLGIPKKVGKEFIDADKGGKLPAKKAEPPMAKPPSGKNPATMTPSATPKPPKLGGAPTAPGKPAAMGAATPAKPKMAFGTGIKPGSGTPAGPFGKSDGMARMRNQHALDAAFKAPLAAAAVPSKPILTHPSDPTRAQGYAEHMPAGKFGKSEKLTKAELGNCPLCLRPEHLGKC